ncbi:MAG: hypothetical protein ACJAX5_003198, partial [Patiriisocius sp.]
ADGIDDSKIQQQKFAPFVVYLLQKRHFDTMRWFSI